MSKILAAWTTLAMLAASSAASAEPPVASGLYEGYSPILMAPFGPLASEALAQKLPVWLDVEAKGQTLTFDVMPDKRVRWVMVYGAHGPTLKTTEVDGQLWTESVFTYDAKGHLATKRVSGPGLDKPLDDIFSTDAKGRRTERRDRASGELRWSAKYSASGAVATTWADGKQAVRRDRFDAGGRRLSTSFEGIKNVTMSLIYKRKPSGELVKIRWKLGQKSGSALPLRRDPDIVSIHLSALSKVGVERHETLMLLGLPVTHSDDGKGSDRAISDDYSSDCWMNAASSLRYDAAGLSVGTGQSCICGFCVDADVSVDATSVLGVDTHWTAGPWVRLDDAIDVTADHKLMTPSGPRAAGDLEAGDAVLGERGEVRWLRSVRRLPRGQARLGRNVRTEAGYFGAGGFLFESEQARPCPPSGPIKY